jgi:hypothetical protein
MKRIVIVALALTTTVCGYSQNYLPLTGGALTGPLTGTTATLSSTVTADGWLKSITGLSNKNSVLANHTFGVYFNNGGDPEYALYREPGEWASPYPNLRLAFHTGIKLGAHFNYGGTRFYNNSDMVTEIMSIGKGDNNVRMGYGLNVVGNVGIGTPASDGRLVVLGTAQANTFHSTALSLEQPYGAFNSNNLIGASTLYKTNNGSNSWKLGVVAGVVGTPTNTGGFAGGLAFFTKPSDGLATTTPIERMRIDHNGNIGIGTRTPDSKLTVSGKIHSQEVKVTVSAGADFVFAKNYNLISISKLAEYISKNQHLPEIASADEMKENGLELGEMNIKLLQKIEELTLYLIDINKTVNDLKHENKVLKASVAELKAN